jgi:hypothetical protein
VAFGMVGWGPGWWWLLGVRGEAILQYDLVGFDCVSLHDECAVKRTRDFADACSVMHRVVTGHRLGVKGRVSTSEVSRYLQGSS